MWQHLRVRLRLLSRQALGSLGAALRALWQVARPVLRTALQLVLALIIVFEEWGWRPLADLLGRLARWRPWAAVEAAIIRLPPYPALIVFTLPSALLLPLKFLALFLIARGQVVLAGLLFLLAKVVATALVARLFILTQPALMQIGWFAWGYERFTPWKEALLAYVRSSWAWRTGRVVKERIKRVVVAEARSWRPALRDLKRWLTIQAIAARAAAARLVHQIREHLAARRS